MQKKSLISILVLAALYITVFTNMKETEAKYTDQLEYLNDNHIKVYNEYGFKTTEQEIIKEIPGVDNAEFSNVPTIVHYFIGKYTPSYNTMDYNVYGFSIPEDSKYQKELDFIDGTYLTDTDQVIITDTLAKGIAEFYGTDIGNLIGSTFGNDLEIVGIYKDSDKDGSFTQIFPGSDFGEENDVYYNSFYTFNTQQQIPSELAINTVNDSLRSKLDMYEAEKLRTVCSPGTDEEYIQVSNETYYLWADYYLFSSGCFIDYDASVAAGISGLIDPNTTEYGEQFNQYLLLSVDEQRRDVIVEEIEKMFPNAAVVTNDTKYTDFKELNENKGIMIGSLVVITLLILAPQIELKKRKK